MKKLSTLIMCIAFAINGNAQSYSFSQFNAAYEELQDDSTLLTDTIESYALLTLPVTFRSFGYDFGDTLSVGSGGYFVSSDYRGIALDPLWSFYYFPDADSKVSYFLNGTDGKHILKVQWKQLAHKTLPDSRVNFQLWVYEENQAIEFRYGPGMMETPVTSGIFLLDRNFTKVLEVTSVGGNPDAPLVQNREDNPLDRFPENGTVYRFDYLRTSIESPSSDALKLYPNPSKGSFEFDSENYKICRITNALGQEQEFQVFGRSIQLTRVILGMYYVHCVDHMGNVVYKELLVNP